MSKLNIYRNTFLEKEELDQLVKFSTQNTALEAILSASLSFGLVSPGSKPGAPFRVTVSTTFGTVNIAGGYVIGPNYKPFYVPSQQNFVIPNDNQYYWIKVAYRSTNTEPGYAAVDASGNLSGTVNFAGLVRGQSSGVATCIKFVKFDEEGNPVAVLNDKVYQVVDIVNDTNLVLSSGYAFQPEQQLKVVILGSMPMGCRFTDAQLAGGLYQYDSYKISLVLETTTGVQPPKDENEYYIARVQNNGGSITILDEREEFWNLGGGGTPSELFTLTILPNPTDARVIIDGVVTNTVTGVNGRTVSYSVSKSGYVTKTGTYTFHGTDETLTVTLVEDPNPPVEIQVTCRTETGDTSQGSIQLNSGNKVASDTQSAIAGIPQTIEAYPAEGYAFAAWYRNGVQWSTNVQENPVLTSDTTFVAYFVPSVGYYWDFEVKLQTPVGGQTHELLTVPSASGTGEDEGVMVKIN